LWGAGVLITACVDGMLRVWDSKSGELKKTLSGHQEAILDFCISNNYQTAVTASDDGACLVFSIQ
jgi:ribosome assembly protein SQT1